LDWRPVCSKDWFGGEEPLVVDFGVVTWVKVFEAFAKNRFMILVQVKSQTLGCECAVDRANACSSD
jgi:hypothetical protein